MSDLEIGGLYALGTAILWTLASLAWTTAGKYIGALAVSFIRLVIAVGLMMLYSGVTRGAWLPLGANLRTWTLLGISGLFGFFLCDICLFKSMLMLGPRLTFLLFSLSPPFTAILSWAWTGDALMPHHWVAMGVTLAGVVWVVMEQPNNDGPASPPNHRWFGIALGVSSAVTNGIGYVLSKQGVGHSNPVDATLIRALASLPAYVALLTISGRWPGIVAASRQWKIMRILTIGATVGPFIGVALNMAALQYAPAGIVATIIGTMPVLVLPLSVFVHHEKIGLRAIGGACIAVVGIAILMWP